MDVILFKHNKLIVYVKSHSVPTRRLQEKPVACKTSAA